MKFFIDIFYSMLAIPVILIVQNGNLIIEKKVYKEVDGNKLHVDIFTLNSFQGKTNNPAIAFFHGGGWVFGNPSEFHGNETAQVFCVVFSFLQIKCVN